MWSPSSKPSVELLPSLLEQLDILMYAGEYDLMCNWLGMEESISSLEWAGGRGFGVSFALLTRQSETLGIPLIVSP